MMCGKCDHCVFLVTGIQPAGFLFNGMKVNTDCRLRIGDWLFPELFKTVSSEGVAK